MSTRAGSLGGVAVTESSLSSAWAYAGEDSERDLRVDFLRGVAMVSVVVVHVEFFSAFNFLVWERVGCVSSAEFFVVLSGFVLGQVSRRRMAREGLIGANWKLWERAAQLYRVLLVVALLVGLLALVPRWNASILTTFVDRGSGAVYALYPGGKTPPPQWLSQWLLLRLGPYQIQILGLYASLLMLAPVALWLLSAGRTRWLLGLSGGAYLCRWSDPVQLTGAIFEYAFPLQVWQVLFFSGLAAGYHRQALLAFYARHRGLLLSASAVLAGAFFFFAQNSPNPLFPPYARLSLISPSVFLRWYGEYFAKSELGPLRILDCAALLVLAGELLTHAWGPLQALFGGFFIPLGQASLYVFTMHVVVVAAAAQLLPFGYSSNVSLVLNTLGHAVCLAALWLMVRYRFLYRWIPR